ncbi:leucine-rich repeat receptor protein kinase HPCA1-like isoform X1 [Zingiber officinale]|uniref:leucine-rich repeat receptor protein kinase HPCA1-like isoform X1 n=2 Tax=Zingiber officinale TaxID=94328 RepID=UPI001C4AE8C2|nr:leucine-rich repeat receptor protein kinase HPCA1-like isoform X1 [Zingiber officinale]
MGILHQELNLKCLLLLLILNLCTLNVSEETQTLESEALALYSISSYWQNKPTSWVGSDPCGNNWVGLNCSNRHIIKIILPGLNISGTLSEDIQNLTELVILDLSSNKGLGGPIPRTIGNLVKLQRLILTGCRFTGSIPPELGMLASLRFLSVGSNRLNGSIPSEIGNLTLLVWFDITRNKISGSLPISDGTNLGLDLLTKCQHFHFGRNNLSGSIPAELFHSEMVLKHMLFDHNQFTGSIPPTLGLVTTIKALRLDRNGLSGAVPSNLNNLTILGELQINDNQLSGSLPNLTGMNALAYVDMSNNSFDQSDIPPWFSTLMNLTTLKLNNLQISGVLPTSLFSIPSLQAVHLRHNLINGTLDLGSAPSTNLTLVDVRENRIQTMANVPNRGNLNIQLDGNFYCNQPGASAQYCNVPPPPNPSSYVTPSPNCGNLVCPSDQKESPKCSCSYPFEGTLVFKFIAFSNMYTNFTYYTLLEVGLIKIFQQFQLPAIPILQDPRMDEYDYFDIDLSIFPSNTDRFSQAEVAQLTNLFTNTTFSQPDPYGPYYLEAVPYPTFHEAVSKSNRVPAIVGGVIGGFAAAALIVGLLIFALCQRRKARKAKELSQGFAGVWTTSGSGSDIPQLKGSRLFTFEELKKCTNNFAESSILGSGGYGRVYRGLLDQGKLVAVKRAQEGSLQGGQEFKTEIEMLSRVHHRNLVSLVGFCLDQNEQILVYEYIPNGTLRDSLSGKSGVYLDWKKRLRVALGAARGLTYLHELANPRIIHRDVKSNNILLDHHLHAKVSDFGLCKPLSDDKKGCVTTQVKGTMGYLDPEYYTTQHLTEKSDVYSFGVVLLEIVTARKPLERGRYVVREVRNAIGRSRDLQGLNELLDPGICHNGSLTGVKRYIDLALKCVEESSSERPCMSEVAKEIENIMVLAGMNPNIASETTSASFGAANKNFNSDDDASFEYSGEPYSLRTVLPK